MAKNAYFASLLLCSLILHFASSAGTFHCVGGRYYNDPLHETSCNDMISVDLSSVVLGWIDVTKAVNYTA